MHWNNLSFLKMEIQKLIKYIADFNLSRAYTLINICFCLTNNFELMDWT